ncbi:MAG: MATE family efflux transporter [Cohaesibacteraceae bacterium]
MSTSLNAPPSDPPPAPPRQTLQWHLRRTLVLAGPLILSRVGLIAMTTTDVVVLGRAGADELAYYVLGYAIVDSLIAVMAGLQLGVPILTARTLGEGRAEQAAAIWRRGLIFALIVGLLLALIMQPASQVFAAMGHEPTLAAGGGAVTSMIGFAIPFMGLYLVSAMFLEALERPIIGTIAVAIATLVNFGFSVALVFGVGPIPALGAWGCALATVMTSFLLGVGLALYVRFALKDRARYGLGRTVDSPMDGREQRKLGFAAGASYGLEAGSFTVLTMIAGLVCVLGRARRGVLFQILALSFMVSFGIAGATQVRVGNAWGRGDAHGMEVAGWVGFALSLVLTLIICAVVLAFPRFFLGLLTTDQAVLAADLPGMIWMVAALLADGGQTVLNHACRGRGDSWVPTSFHAVSYWLIMIPLGWLFAITLDNGTIGLFQAILVASLFSMTVMAIRFIYLSRKGLPPLAPTV